MPRRPGPRLPTCGRPPGRHRSPAAASETEQMQANGNSAPTARGRHGRYGLMAAVTAAALIAAAAPAAAQPAARPGSIHETPASRVGRGTAMPPSAEAAAMATAKATHRTVAVAAETTETSVTVAHPDGPSP